MQFYELRRREFITLLGGRGRVAACGASAAAGDAGGRVPQRRALSSDAHLVAAFRRGLSEASYVEGQNIAVEYRWVEGQSQRVAEFVADFIRRQVKVIFAGGGDAEVRAVKAAIGEIPMVFAVGGDPVEYGLVARLNWPGGNATGVTVITASLWPKRLELLAS